MKSQSRLESSLKASFLQVKLDCRPESSVCLLPPPNKLDAGTLRTESPQKQRNENAEVQPEGVVSEEALLDGSIFNWHHAAVQAVTLESTCGLGFQCGVPEWDPNSMECCCSEASVQLVKALAENQTNVACKQGRKCSFVCCENLSGFCGLSCCQTNELCGARIDTGDPCCVNPRLEVFMTPLVAAEAPEEAGQWSPERPGEEDSKGLQRIEGLQWPEVVSLSELERRLSRQETHYCCPYGVGSRCQFAKEYGAAEQGNSGKVNLSPGGSDGYGELVPCCLDLDDLSCKVDPQCSLPAQPMSVLRLIVILASFSALGVVTSLASFLRRPRAQAEASKPPTPPLHQLETSAAHRRLRKVSIPGSPDGALSKSDSDSELPMANRGSITRRGVGGGLSREVKDDKDSEETVETKPGSG